MPNPNTFSADLPVQRPEEVTGLSQIVTPTYDYKTTFPPTDSLNTGGNPEASQDPNQGFWVNDSNALKNAFGGVPVAPGGITPAIETRQYNDKTLKFLPGRDNEDIYAQNQGFFNSVGHGLGRLVGLSVSKTGTGLGYLAGLVGIDNDSEKYGGKGFNSWVAGAGDNGIAKWFTNLEDEKIKQDWFPIYAKASEKDHGFFRHAGDLDFWTNDLTDGAAWVISSFALGGGVSKLKLGARTISGLNLLKGEGYASALEGLSKEGVTGAVESNNLLKQGLGATIENPELKNIVTQADQTQQISKAIKWSDNAKLARNIDVGTTSVINTASQAMFSANNAKNNTYDALINQKDDLGNNKYTVEQAKQTAAKVARDSYIMNLGALSLMNLYEANFLFKTPESSAAFRGKTNVNGLFGDVSLQKASFGQKIYNAVKEPGKGFLTAGVWLGNMQLAIDRLNTNPDNFNLDFGTKLKDLGQSYKKQLVDALTGKDIDASKALGLGGFMGAVLGKALGKNEIKQNENEIADLNKQVSAFRGLDNIYKTDSDGKLILENGNPTLDENKVKSWAASYNKILSLQQLSRNFENRGVGELSKVYSDEVFSRFVKAHLDRGMGDILFQKLQDIGNISKEDLALLGYDPESKNADASQKLNNYIDKAKSLENLYNNINNNFVSVTLNPNSKEGAQKRFDMVDKMFYLSARSQTLSEIIKNSKEQYESIKANTDAYNEAFNSTTDEVVNKYNELFEKAYSAGRQPSDHPEMYGINADYERIQDIRDESKSDLDKFAEENKETLNRLKKDSRGRYLYEIANKNLLPSAKEMERQQIIQAESTLSRNATMNVLSRLSDVRFGEKYYDDIYSKEMDRHQQEVDALNQPDETEAEKAVNDFYKDPTKDNNKLESDITEEEIDNAAAALKNDEPVQNGKNIADHIAEKISKGQDLTENEELLRKKLSNQVEDSLTKRSTSSDLNDLNDQSYELERKRDSLENKEDRTEEEETELENLNNQINALNDQSEIKRQELDNQIIVDDSKNIKEEDKSKFLDVLNKINNLKRRVVKTDTFYEVDGEKYRKVTDIIGDSIPEEIRKEPKIQAAINAGNTIDSIVKSYFSPDGLNQTFKDSVSDKVSDDAYNNIVKNLDKIKKNLTDKGIEIVGSNVFIVDDTLKVAGEIDLLGVDKNGNFKIYEVQARRGDVYASYGKRGLGVKLRDIDGKRLSMYRNMFANQYGAIPDEISIKFPFDVKYDKTNPNGFIDGAKVKEPIRFQPLKNVEVKMKNSEPLKIGSKYNSLDMNRIFLNTFLPTKEMGDKLKFLFRNITSKELINGIKMTVKKALPEFQEKFSGQKLALEGQPTEYKINKFKDYRNKDQRGNPREFGNLYTLVGDTEMSLSHEGTNVGFLSPVQTLAYKDTDGTFKILDENTDAQTYSDVTGNDIGTYDEFRKTAAAYKKLHTELSNRAAQSPTGEISLSNEELQKLVDIKPSVGEFDLLAKNADRPLLKDLNFSGIKIGGKQLPVVVNVDADDTVKVLMEKNRKNQATIKKYQEMDKWAVNNLDKVKAAMFDRDGVKLTDNVAIIEDPSGQYKVIALRTKGTFNPAEHEDFVEDLGSKFTAATTKAVFKNENLMIVPKQTEESINLGLKEHDVISKVYPTEDINTVEKFGLEPKVVVTETIDSKIEDFLKNPDPEVKQSLEDFGLTSKDALRVDFEEGDWSSIDDYLDNLRNCK